MVDSSRLAEIWVEGRRDDEVLLPIGIETVDAIVSTMSLNPASTVLDVGCANANVLIRIAKRFGATCTGLDTRQSMIHAGLRAAQGAAVRNLVTLHVEEGFAFPILPESMDAAMCLGESWILGGYRRTLASLARDVRGGGLILAGEGFAFEPPEQAYFRGRTTSASAFRSHEGNITIGIEEGLEPIGQWVSSLGEWEDYHERRFQSIRRWLDENPLDRDAATVSSVADDAEARFRLRDRDEQGWAVYLFRKPRTPR